MALSDLTSLVPDPTASPATGAGIPGSGPAGTNNMATDPGPIVNTIVGSTNQGNATNTNTYAAGPSQAPIATTAVAVGGGGGISINQQGQQVDPNGNLIVDANGNPIGADGKPVNGSLNAATGGGYALQSDGSYKYTPNAAQMSQNMVTGYTYANPAAFAPTGAQTTNINNALNNQGNLANTTTPATSNTSLGSVAQLGGAQTGQVAQSGNTAIVPAMMVNGATIDTSADNVTAAQQNTNINNLTAMSQGQGPNPAAVAAQQQAQAQIQANAALLGSQRGAANSSLGLRAAQINAAQANQNAAANTVSGTVAQEVNAQNALQPAISSARTANQNIATTQAGLVQNANLSDQGAYNTVAGNQANLTQANNQNNTAAVNAVNLSNTGNVQAAQTTNAGALNTANTTQAQMDQANALANLQTQFNQGQLNDQQYNTAVANLMTQTQQGVSNNVAAQQLLGSEQTSNADIAAKLNVNASNQNLGVMGTALGAVGTVGSTLVSALGGSGGAGAATQTSDKHLKKNIRSADRSIRSFLNAINGRN